MPAAPYSCCFCFSVLMWLRNFSETLEEMKPEQELPRVLVSEYIFVLICDEFFFVLIRINL